MAQLPKDLEEKLDHLIDFVSYDAFESGQIERGLAILDHAWSLLPDPKNNWAYYSQAVGSNALTECLEHNLVAAAKIWLERTKFAYPKGSDQAQQLLDVWETQYKYLARSPDSAQFAAQTLQRWGTALLESRGQKYLHFARTGERTEVTAAVPSRRGPSTVDSDQIEILSEEGSALLANDWRAALTKWNDALALIPEPRDAYDESTWLYTSIGDAYHSGELWPEAVTALKLALRCPGGTDNGYLRLRLGESLYELGQLDDAADNLMSAQLLDGDPLFAGEDSRYRRLLVERGLINP